jgi:hypothetical protein
VTTSRRHHPRKRCAHCDERSTEPSTRATKRKYKLFTNVWRELGLYTYLVATTNQSATKPQLTLTVRPADWVSRKSPHLRRISYFDVRKASVATEAEVQAKLADPQNGLPRVGILRTSKYRELLALRSQAHLHGYQPDKTLQTIHAAIGPRDRAEAIVQKLDV